MEKSGGERNKNSIPAQKPEQNPLRTKELNVVELKNKELTGINTAKLETDHAKGHIYPSCLLNVPTLPAYHFPAGSLTNEIPELCRQLFPGFLICFDYISFLLKSFN